MSKQSKNELEKTEQIVRDFEHALVSSANIPLAFRSALTSAEIALLKTFLMWYQDSERTVGNSTLNNNNPTDI
jgi:hypothetical protein